jgi:hypothetical protein
VLRLIGDIVRFQFSGGRWSWRSVDYLTLIVRVVSHPGSGREDRGAKDGPFAATSTCAQRSPPNLCNGDRRRGVLRRGIRRRIDDLARFGTRLRRTRAVVFRGVGVAPRLDLGEQVLELLPHGGQAGVAIGHIRGRRRQRRQAAGSLLRQGRSALMASGRCGVVHRTALRAWRKVQRCAATIAELRVLRVDPLAERTFPLSHGQPEPLV